MREGAEEIKTIGFEKLERLETTGARREKKGVEVPEAEAIEEEDVEATEVTEDTEVIEEVGVTEAEVEATIKKEGPEVAVVEDTTKVPAKGKVEDQSLIKTPGNTNISTPFAKHSKKLT